MTTDPNAVVTVIGGGNFGTVIANLAAARGRNVQLWMRDPELVEEVARLGENRRYLPGHPVHERVVPTADLAAAVRASNLLFVCVPSASFRQVTSDLAPYLQPGAAVVSTTKGIEADGFRLMSEILEQCCPGHPVGALSGPNIAEEIAAGDYAGTVIASEHESLREQVQKTLHSRAFRVYSNPDRYGVELAGALKNVYAVAAGMAAALGAGQNARAMLITRGLGEMSRMASSLGANPLTFLGLAGVGDLMVTCSSPLSRNYQLGFAVGRGTTLAEAQAQLGKLAEGVNTIAVTHARAQALGVPMPIVQGLYEILFQGRGLAEVLVRLMLAEQRDDVEFIATPEHH